MRQKFNPREDYYARLMIDRAASLNDVKRAYRYVPGALPACMHAPCPVLPCFQSIDLPIISQSTPLPLAPLAGGWP